MRPLDDWMELRLWEGQQSAVEVRIALPDNIDPVHHEAAVFEVINLGEGAKERVKIGDIVALKGMAVGKMKKPNGESTLVAQAADVCFIMEEEDLKRRE